jgi:ribonuclease E
VDRTAIESKAVEEADEVEDDESAAVGAHHAGSAAESRANRRRRRKGKHHDGEDAPGTPVDSAWTLDAPAPSAARVPESGVASEGSEGAVSVEAATSVVTAAPPVEVEVAPINLKAHAEDPDAAVAADGLGEALSDTGRPRKRRRAASRPAGSPQSTAEAS